MLVKGLFRWSLIAMLLGGGCLLNSVWAAAPLANPPVADIALSEGGRLDGKVADPQGRGVPNVLVALRIPDREPVTTSTIEDGRFAFQGLPGGVYQLNAGRTNYVMRAWAPETAPPAAQAQAVLYLQDVGGPNVPGATGGVMGGGEGDGGGIFGLGPTMSSIVISTAVATAISLPIALSVRPSPISP